MKTSVIIPVYNGLFFLEKLSESIVENTDMNQCEVIIVDDASDKEDMSGLYSKLEKTGWFKVVRNSKNLGFGASNNAGVKQASGEYLYLLNSDTLVLKGWIENSLAFFDNGMELFGIENIGAVQSKIILPKENSFVTQTCGSIFDAQGWPIYKFNDLSINDPRVNNPFLCDSFMGCGVMIKKEIFDDVGGFDECFGKYYYEDTDLSLRISQNGYKIAYNPSSAVVHFHGMTTSVYVEDRDVFDENCEKSKTRFRQKWPAELIKSITKK